MSNNEVKKPSDEQIRSLEEIFEARIARDEKIEPKDWMPEKYRKTHIPQVDPGFYEKFFFKPGDLGYPVFETAYLKLGIYICYDRHFPEGWRALALNGAEYIFLDGRA